ncbi:MAG: repair protein RecN [Actinomycetota bacterium]|nr:repair protein RecN [Actinomycetota bacterium]
MRIRGLGVIDDAVLELSPGLTVITGETGAGKTMVVTGLGLLFGGRADSGVVRPGVARALVEGRLRISDSDPAAQRAIDAGAELDDGVLILARSVSGEGRSRAYVGGLGVPAGVLSDLAESSLAVHGQSDQSRLLRPIHQREALDRYAGAAVSKPQTSYAAAFHDLRALDAELTELTTRSRERAQEADLLRFGLEEIEAVDPQPGEEDALAAEEDRLTHADMLRSAASGAHESLVGAADETGASAAADAVALVGAARAGLEQAGDHDAALAALAARVSELGYLLTDVAGDLASYVAGIEVDPARLGAVGERRAALTRLIRKYGAEGGTVAEVLAWSRTAAVRVTALDTDDDRINELTARRAELVAELTDLASRLSVARRKAAARFSKAVTAELPALAMRDATVQVEVTQGEVEADGSPWLLLDGRRVGCHPHGVDDVEMQLCPHKGAPARALQRGASGGELSRVMLAVEVVLAGADPVPTLVFDEVDAGVGGRAAVEVGSRLAALARTAQVLVVTHLPQVAAFADQHLVVRKASDGAVTRSGVTTLDEAGRLQELSRMLAGLEESESAQAHARELLEVARAAKTP